MRPISVLQKKRGRAATGQVAVTAVRLSSDLRIALDKAAIDAEQRADGKRPSRSEMIRRIPTGHLSEKVYLAAAAPHLGRTAKGVSDARGMADLAIDRAFHGSREPAQVKDRRRRALTEMPRGGKGKRAK